MSAKVDVLIRPKRQLERVTGFAAGGSTSRDFMWAFLKREVAGNPVLSWAAAAALTLALVALALMLRRMWRRRPSPERVINGLFYELLSAVRIPLIAVSALWAGALVLQLPPKASQAVRVAAITALLVQGALLVRAIIGYMLGGYRRRKTEEDPGAATTLGLIQFLANFVVLVVASLVILDNLGVNITALVAGLGIGGIAVAMAAQTLLADLFASLSIVLDKPFKVGDTIVVGDAMGVVESIGLKSTLLRSPTGETLVFANGDLLRGRIRNFGRLRERRVELAVGAALSTPVDKVEYVPTLLREAVEAQPLARFERAHLKEVGACLQFEIVYHVKDAAYGAHMDTQEAVQLAVLRRFHEDEIELASPARTLYVASGVAPVRW
jgi:small-conductance mechanosensitive channel